MSDRIPKEVIDEAAPNGAVAVPLVDPCPKGFRAMTYEEAIRFMDLSYRLTIETERILRLESMVQRAKAEIALWEYEKKDGQKKMNRTGVEFGGFSSLLGISGAEDVKRIDGRMFVRVRGTVVENPKAPQDGKA